VPFVFLHFFLAALAAALAGALAAAWLISLAAGFLLAPLALA